MNLGCTDHGRTRSVHKFGYAVVRRAGVLHYLHRLVHAESLGIPITAIVGLVVRHTCDNPRCINPAHLVTGTQADNMQDMAVRGRASSGEDHAHAKLTEETVLAIRTEYVPRCREHGTRAIARRLGVSHWVISHAIRGLTWKGIR